MRASVELTHFYADGCALTPVELECAQRAATLESVVGQRVVLVDDYHCRPQRLAKLLGELPQAPHGVFSEAALASHVPELLERSRSRDEARSARRYWRGKGEWPCSALTAVWLGLRLGAITDPPPPVWGEELQAAPVAISVLPERYRPSEQRAHRLLEGLRPGLAARARTLWVSESSADGRAALEAPSTLAYQSG